MVQLMETSILILSVYYMLAMVVHPWYICFLLLFSVFAQSTYIIAWTGIIIVTYITYSVKPYSENLYFVAGEYLIVGLVFYLNYKGRLQAYQLLREN